MNFDNEKRASAAGKSLALAHHTFGNSSRNKLFSDIAQLAEKIPGEEKARIRRIIVTSYDLRMHAMRWFSR